MYLEEGLEILVKEWMQLLAIGEADLSMAEVIKKLGSENWARITPDLSPGEVAGLIEQDLSRLGIASRADGFMSRFRTEDELLSETSLYDLINDLATPEEFREQLQANT